MMRIEISKPIYTVTVSMHEGVNPIRFNADMIDAHIIKTTPSIIDEDTVEITYMCVGEEMLQDALNVIANYKEVGK